MNCARFVRPVAGLCHSSTPALLALLLALPVLVAAPGPAAAGESGLMAPGDAAVTQFSGTRIDKSAGTNVNPLDATMIDEKGAALRVLDLSKPGPPDAAHATSAPAKLSVKAGDIGQVFGVALDSTSATEPANIYAAISVSDFPARWVEGEPGEVKRFADANQASLALDHDGAPVFLARNAWHLGKAEEDWPKLRFLKTKEQTA